MRFLLVRGRAGMRWADQRAAVAGWRYAPEGSRDPRLDLLRGALVFAMMVDHLGGASWLYPITGGNRFYVSAAEGFVFLSGLVMGLVYARLIAKEGLRAAARRAGRRAVVLYGIGLALAFVFTVLSSELDATWGRPIADPFQLLLAIATLREELYLADVLMLYALLLLLAPVALALLARGLVGPLLAGSGALWLLHQLGATAPLEAPLVGLAWFPPFAWQLVFVAGLALGFNWRRLHAWAARRRPERALPALALAAAGLIGLALWAPASPAAEPVAAFFGKEGLGPGRLLAAAVFFPLLFGLTTLVWRPLAAGLGWLLLPLGQSALSAYSLHLFLALLANVTLPLLPGYEMDDPRVNTLAQVLAVLVLWGLVRGLSPATGALAGLPTWWRAADGPARAVGLLRAGLASAALLGLVALGRPALPRLPAVPADTATASLAIGGAPGNLSDGAGPAAAATAPAPSPRARRSAPAGPSPRAGLPATPVIAPAAGPPAAAGEVVWQGPPTAAGVSTALRRSFFSPALDRQMSYLIFLPAGYEGGTTAYPVLYLLHGIGGGMTEWAEAGLFGAMVELLGEGSVRPMLIVLPEGEQSYWVNHVNGPRWGDYVALDLVAHIDADYRTIPRAQARAIGGLSMGAHGALQLAITYPSRFGAVGLHSPSLRPEDEALSFLGSGDDFKQRDPLWLVQTGRLPAGIHLWIDAGDDDPWRDGAVALHETLDEQGVAHTWRPLPGIHDNPYWAEHLKDYLRFYDAALRSRPAAK